MFGIIRNFFLNVVIASCLGKESGVGERVLTKSVILYVSLEKGKYMLASSC
jgi:hypothetical protein